MDNLKRETPEAGQASGGAFDKVRGDYNTVGEKLTSDSPLYPLYSDITQPEPAKFLSLAELVWLAIDPSIGPKNKAAALTPFKANVKRKEVAVTSDFHALVTDHDDDDKTADQIRAAYDRWNVAYMAFTSASHEQEKHGITGKRWKPVIPLAYAVSYERYNVLSRGLMLMNGTDAVQSRSQQVFYAPNKISKAAPFDYIDETERPFLDPHDDSHPLIKACVEAYEAETKRQEAKASKATSKPRPTVTGEQAGIIGKVLDAYSDIGAIIDQYDYKRAGSRWRCPNSTSGIPGVVRLTGSDGRERLYSHHGEADPLSNLNNDGHALDVFDVLVALEYGGDFSRAVCELAKDLDPEGQRQRQRDHMAAKSAVAAVEQFGSTVTKEAQKLADYIHKQLMEWLQVNPDTQPDEAESLKPDAERITRMINGAFWSGGKSKVFLLNHSESLIQFTEKDSFRFLVRTFGHVIDKAAVTALAKVMVFGCASPEAEEKARAKHISGCMGAANSAIMDHLKYTNQRESIEWRVDMFAKNSRMELLEDKARIVLTHRPFPTSKKPDDYAAIVADYKEHFSRFDEFLKFLVAARFSVDRKKAYLWILATSDWGKGFLIGVLKNLGCCVETSMKEVEAMLEGKPVGRSAEDFKRAFVLLIDEFKTVKSELKQLQSEISLSPKNQLTCTVEVFAKVFTSAESVSSLVTENGVEDQFANRMSIFQEDGDITKRPLYKQVGNARYIRAVQAYTARFLNDGIAKVQKSGREKAEAEAEEYLNGFIARNGLDTVYERFSDSLPGLAAELVEYFTDGDGNMSSLVINDHGAVYLRSPAKAVDDYLRDHYDPSQITAFRIKKNDLIRLMSVDGAGNQTHRVNGVSKKAVKLKV
jgi:hypothetical protein